MGKAAGEVVEAERAELEQVGLEPVREAVSVPVLAARRLVPAAGSITPARGLELAAQVQALTAAVQDPAELAQTLAPAERCPAAQVPQAQARASQAAVLASAISGALALAQGQPDSEPIPREQIPLVD